jgi:ribosomal protein L11 methyltransferase
MVRLAVRCRPELAEPVLAELLELAPGGVEEERGRGYVEYAIYGPRGELPSLHQLKAAAGEGVVEVTAGEVPDDWGDRWRDFHRPLIVAGRLRVRPSWDAEAAGEQAPGAIDVVIDPGRAFGTGAHPTTRLCLELLVELAESGQTRGPLADWGTGSGVLAIAAAKLGWAPVTGCDHEAVALQAARANASANGVELKLERVNLREDRPPSARTVTANLTAPALLSAAERLNSTPERLICSGLLPGEAHRIAAAFAPHGLAEAERRERGDWVALLLDAG